MRLMVDTIREHVEVVPGEGWPKARIAGHRIRVQDVALWHEKLGMSVDEIVYQYPTITLSDVYAALAYYWDHRDEIERAIGEERAVANEFRRSHLGPLQRKLSALERD